MDEQTPATGNNAAAQDAAGSDTNAATMTTQRRRWLAIVAAALVIAGVAYGAYWAIDLRYIQFTDNAYVGGNVVQITPQISGTVIAIGADETNFVDAGKTLVQLDQADAQIALAQADAQLAKTVRDVRNLFATSAQLRANVDARRSDFAKASDDLARRERLAGSGAVSKEEVQHARDAAKSANADLVAAQEGLGAQRARIDRTTIEGHPDVRSAAARVHDAYLAYARTTLPAPVSGFVAKRAVQLGQRVSPGAALMAVVPLDQVWVDANFKERQLEGMRVGQPVKLTADIYGSRIAYHGRVAGFGAGTGAAFALLPAQNATGNWIKIVQRVPVRIALDQRELAAYPLQIGLSTEVEVDTRDRSGARLPQAAQANNSYRTDVFKSIESEADARVKRIVAANNAVPPHGTGAPE
jgi:membrane fusion protein (multidrug efflux system)